jgi:hypothetical protein
MRFYSLGQLSREDKDNILNKHRELYNGYRRVHQPVNNESPLYVQDFANDKAGVTVSNTGEVTEYNNKIYMKESKGETCKNCGCNMKECKCCKKCGSEMKEGVCEQCSSGEIEEGIYDVEDLNPKEKFDYVEEEIDEISLDKLKKGGKYKFKSPSYEDEIEYLGKDEFERGNPHYSFRGKNDTWHSMGDKFVDMFVHDDDEENDTKFYEPMESAFNDELDEIEGPLYSKVDPAYNFKSDGPMQAKGPYAQNEQEDEDIIDLDDLMSDEDEYDTAFSRMKRGYEPEDIDYEPIDTVFSKMKKGNEPEDIEWEDVDDDIKESLLLQKNKITEMFNRFKKYN